MDPVKILRRAWQILWSYRALWIFGLILSLAGAGTMPRGSNNGSRVQYETSPQNTQSLPRDMADALRQAIQEMQRLLQEGLTKSGIPEQQWPTLIWIAAGFVVLCLLIGIIVAIARYVAETAAIRMVDEYEATGSKMTIRQGFRAGWSRTSWRLFLINLLVHVPLIVALMLLLTIGYSIYQTISHNGGEPSAASIFGVIVTAFLILFGAALVTILLKFLRNFVWRASVLENVGVGESFRRGFQMVRENWKSVGVMWLVMIGLGIVWALVSTIVFFITIPVILVTGALGALVAAIPALLAGGPSSLFLSGWLPWIVGALFALPLFLMLAFSPWILVGGWQAIFSSTVWTLVYRELKALPALTNGNTAAETAAD